MKSRSPGLSGSGLKRALFLLFQIFFLQILNLKWDAGTGSVIQTRAQVPARGVFSFFFCFFKYRLKFCERTWLHQPNRTRCHDNSNYLPLRAGFLHRKGAIMFFGHLHLSGAGVKGQRKQPKSEQSCEKRWNFIFNKHFLKYLIMCSWTIFRLTLHCYAKTLHYLILNEVK